MSKCHPSANDSAPLELKGGLCRVRAWERFVSKLGQVY